VKTQSPLASRGRRLATFVLDLLFFFVLAALVLALSPWEATGRAAEYFVTAGLYAGYYLIQEGLWGRTLAKLVTGTRVLALDGSPPAFLRILERTFVRLLPFEPLSFFGSTPEGWHDEWSRTKVVYIRGT
jgi:uncharacterized RDD family membrane protein YckC